MFRPDSPRTPAGGRHLGRAAWASGRLVDLLRVSERPRRIPFESYNKTIMFIRHYQYVVYIASDGGPAPWDTSESWHHDTTWNVARPWA
jgi:hypothetical protein